MANWNALAVAAEETSDAIVVAFGENADGTGGTFVLEAPLDEDDDDDDDDLYTYCVIVDGGPTHQGGITECEVGADWVRFQFVASAAEALGIEDGLTISFPAEHRERVIDGLSDIFDWARTPVRFAVE